MRALAAAAALFVAVSSDAPAQVVESSKSPDAARLQAAEHYYSAADYEADVKLSVEALIKQFAKAVAQRGGKPDTDTEKQISDLIRPDFQSIIDFRHKRMVDSFAEHLSTQDLIELTDFIRTPLGVRFTKVKTVIVQEVYAGFASELQSLRGRVWAGHSADFTKLGLSFGGTKQQ